MRIEDEIQQRKSFASAKERSVVNVLFTASWLNGMQSEILKPFNITVQQFNILRILKGRYPEPSSVKLLTSRMIDRMSNASRLVDKLEARKLVERKPCEDDRRKVEITINEAGIQLINQASQAMNDLIEAQLGLTEKQAERLSELLDKMRK